MNRLTSIALGVWLLAASTAHAQTVIYRETFGRSSPAPDTLPDQEVGTGNVLGDQFDWPTFRNDATGFAVRNPPPTTPAASAATPPWAPIDMANVNAGTNADGTTDAYARGLYFMSQNDGSPKLAWTSEFSFNPANYSSLSFNWWQGNNDPTAAFQLAIRIGGAWFVNNTQFVNNPDYPDGIGMFNGNAQQMTLVFNKAAAEWSSLDFDGTWDAATNMGTDSTLPLAVGAPAAADLSGAIDGFGLLSVIHVDIRRFDTFEIKGTLVGGKPGDFDTDNNVDGEDFLRWQRGLSPTPLSAIDLTAWKGGYAMAAAASNAVPEPTAGVLMLLGSVPRIAARRRPARRLAKA